MSLTPRSPPAQRKRTKPEIQKKAQKRVVKTAPAKSRAKPAVKRKVAAASDVPVVEAALAAFAHEVRTPLTGILAISDLLATSDLGERERRWVETIKVGAEHLAGLATLFVDAASSSKSRMEVRQDFFDLRVFARSIGDSLAGRAAAKGLKATVEISARIPAFVIGDPVRLRASLENLIDNAVKFTDAGDVALKVTAVRAAKGQVAISFKVSDSGIGLSLAEIKRLFRPFSQANVTIAARFGGAGLGLSSARQLARAMGGDIEVAPRRGGGTVFTLGVTLARAEAPDAAMADIDLMSEPHQSMRVLSVEDNPFGRVVLNAILTELGHKAEFIGRGEDAAERLAQGDFDVVLMDMVLPGIGGIAAIRQIRALASTNAKIPIIGVSGRNDDEAGARKAGANEFLVKPVSPRVLAQALLAASRRGAGAS